ncbi:MAG: hypothetical protein ACJ8FH_06000 [Sphingomicrobium sp.]
MPVAPDLHRPHRTIAEKRSLAGRSGQPRRPLDAGRPTFDVRAIVPGEELSAINSFNRATLGLLDALAFDPLRTLGSLEALAFDPLRTLGSLEGLAFDPSRTLGPLDALAFDPLRTFGPLEALALDPLRTLGTLEALAFHALRALGPLAALCALRTVRLRFDTGLARLRTAVAILATPCAMGRPNQRQGRDTGYQKQLASHYDLLAQFKNNVISTV